MTTRLLLPLHLDDKLRPARVITLPTEPRRRLVVPREHVEKVLRLATDAALAGSGAPPVPAGCPYVELSEHDVLLSQWRATLFWDDKDVLVVVLGKDHLRMADVLEKLPKSSQKLALAHACGFGWKVECRPGTSIDAPAPGAVVPGVEQDDDVPLEPLPSSPASATTGAPPEPAAGTASVKATLIGRLKARFAGHAGRRPLDDAPPPGTSGWWVAGLVVVTFAVVLAALTYRSLAELAAKYLEPPQPVASAVPAEQVASAQAPPDPCTESVAGTGVWRLVDGRPYEVTDSVLLAEVARDDACLSHLPDDPWRQRVKAGAGQLAKPKNGMVDAEAVDALRAAAVACRASACRKAMWSARDLPSPAELAARCAVPASPVPADADGWGELDVRREPHGEGVLACRSDPGFELPEALGRPGQLYADPSAHLAFADLMKRCPDGVDPKVWKLVLPRLASWRSGGELASAARAVILAATAQCRLRTCGPFEPAITDGGVGTEAFLTALDHCRETHVIDDGEHDLLTRVSKGKVAWKDVDFVVPELGASPQFRKRALP